MTPDETQEMLDRITAIYQTTRETEFGDVCHRIAYTAHQIGEYHADAAATWELTNRNALGLAVRHLQRNGIIESTGEHRAATTAAGHGRRSYVYRLTSIGQRAIYHWPNRPRATDRRQQMIDDAWPETLPAQQTIDLNASAAS